MVGYLDQSLHFMICHKIRHDPAGRGRVLHHLLHRRSSRRQILWCDAQSAYCRCSQRTGLHWCDGPPVAAPRTAGLACMGCEERRTLLPAPATQVVHAPDLALMDFVTQVPNALGLDATGCSGRSLAMPTRFMQRTMGRRPRVAASRWLDGA